MKFDSPGLLEEILWDMRVSDEPRAADRAVLLKLYNGNPPFDESTVEENNIQVNRSDLTGVNTLTQARRQWYSAFLKPANFFVARPDFGPAHKRAEWSQIVTRNANRLLKRNRKMRANIKCEGANVVLYGIGPSMWKDRRTPIPTGLPVGSLMVPSETEVEDFDNLPYFAVFREWNAAQLYEMTHGPKVDPGWNMKLVEAQMDYIRDELRKSPNSLAYQYMPERIEELIKQDKGYFGSDAVPTVDVWDFYFREDEEGKGWYRRIILDWGSGSDISAYSKSGTRPDSRNKVGEETNFLYTSGKRKYADSLDQILHCQFGDCSAYAPFKYHSVRSLGWMLWGVCDLQNRLHCKFNEAVFEQMMWFFQTAGNQDLMRLKKANFEHMGIIPQGIRFLTPQERYIPNSNLIEMAFSRNRQLISDSSTTYTRDYEKVSGEKSRTATETMAIVNSSQALSSGILEEAYSQSVFKYREIFRRMCLKNSADKMAREFQKTCLADGIPEKMLDVDKWTLEPDQVVGGGNKTTQMAIIAFLNSIRPNLPPNGQRIIDNMSVMASLEQPELAQEIAPLGEDNPPSGSRHDAQLATDRLLRGLEFEPPKDAVYEDYVAAWIEDLGRVTNAVMEKGVPTPEELTGMLNLGKYIQQFLDVMSKNPADAQRVRQYNEYFSQITDHIKSLGQRLQQQMKAQGTMKPGGNGAAEEMAKTQAKIQSIKLLGEVKKQNARESHAERTQQKQISWEKQEARKDQETAADIQRKGVQTRHDLLANRIRVLSEIEE